MATQCGKAKQESVHETSECRGRWASKHRPPRSPPVTPTTGRWPWVPNTQDALFTGLRPLEIPPPRGLGGDVLVFPFLARGLTNRPTGNTSVG